MLEMKSSGLALALTVVLSFAPMSAVHSATVKPDGKCEYDRQTVVSGGKFFTCRNGKWDKGVTATPIRIAFAKCKLWKANEIGFTVASVLDGGQTLQLDEVGKYYLEEEGLTYDDMTCALKALRSPSYVMSRIDNTRALDGTQQASWSRYKAFWNYHPDDGATLTITSAG